MCREIEISGMNGKEILVQLRQGHFGVINKKIK